MTDREHFALVIVGLVIAGLAVISISVTVILWGAFRREGAVGPISEMMQHVGVPQLLTQLLTVQAIVMSVLILRIIDGLGPEAAVSILSGIAGYVLGGVSRGSGPAPAAPRPRRENLSPGAADHSRDH
jgi:hypothetical protein